MIRIIETIAQMLRKCAKNDDHSNARNALASASCAQREKKKKKKKNATPKANNIDGSKTIQFNQQKYSTKKNNKI
jgi:hypothetical protein